MIYQGSSDLSRLSNELLFIVRTNVLGRSLNDPRLLDCVGTNTPFGRQALDLSLAVRTGFTAG